MAKWSEQCPKCGSDRITGRGFDTGDGDEWQERYCFACEFGEQRLRSQGGASWYVEEKPVVDERAETLLAEIYANPDDDGPRSIYADHLIEKGDPRGQFIALQLARYTKRDPVVSGEEQKLLDEHWKEWLGGVKLEAANVEFERGFWSATRGLDASRITAAHAASPAWSTVRSLAFFGPGQPPLATLLGGPLHGALRSIEVPSRETMNQIAQWKPTLSIEEMILAFDLSRDPPALPPLSLLPKLHTLGFHCEAEFGERWIERADDAGIRNVTLMSRAHPDYVRRVLKRVKRTRLLRLTFELGVDHAPVLAETGLAVGRLGGATVLHVERDRDDSLAIRRIELRPSHVSPVEAVQSAKQWITDLGTHVDPGVKITMPEVSPQLAQYADSIGLKLVRSATRLGAIPRAKKP